ncbi:MAG: LuxR C-terminal-related transcriptional regulator [Planctomycetaceae bacterium]
MLQKRPRITRRKKRVPQVTEFDNPKKRKDFTVFLVEDDQEIRASMRQSLDDAKITCEDYMTAMEFYRDYRELRPGVLVVDIRLHWHVRRGTAGETGQEDFPLPIVMISGHADVPMAVRAMKNGAYDMLCKPVRIEDLVQCISRAYHYYYDLELDMDDELDDTEDSLNRLTTREREVLDHVVDGLSSREIADELSVSTKTVEAHRARINDKMRADNVAHLIRMCFNYNAAEGL